MLLTPQVILVLVLAAGVNLGHASITVDKEAYPLFDDLLVTYDPADTSSHKLFYNRALDLIIDFINLNTRASGKSEIPLPDIGEDFRTKALWITIKGHFRAHEGVFRDLATVQRRGDTTITPHGDGQTFTVTTHVGLGSVSLRYGHYNARVGGPSVSGHIDGYVGDNSIKVQATVTLADNGDCAARLDEVKVEQLDGLRVRVGGSGFGVLNWLITSFTNSYASNNRDKIIASIEKGLREIATKELSRIDCKS